MIITVIPVKDYRTAKKALKSVHPLSDGVEFRLDYTPELHIKTVAQLQHEYHKPIIFTLRKASQGGMYAFDEKRRLQEILDLCKLKPEYLDLEYDTSLEFFEKIHLTYPEIKLISSYHDFNKTPQEPKTILKSMRNPVVSIYKIAVKANNILDSLKLLEFVQSSNKAYNLSVIAMGEEGSITRILGPVFGNALNYVSLDESNKTAPGQLTLKDLLKTYHFQKLNTKSKIYALLGDPIHLSAGVILYNRAIEYLQKNAVYVKLRLNSIDLAQIIEKTRHLTFSGFSITMPLKTAILPLLDRAEASVKSLQAVNGIKVHNDHHYYGFNTDGIGAVQALKERINIDQKIMVILGAGGAARAIAYEALQHKARVILLSRSLNKAQDLANQLGCEAYKLEDLVHLKALDYEILINTLPMSAYLETLLQDIMIPGNIPPKILAMDIVYELIQTPFLKAAKTVGCTLIFGYEIYINQALLQIKHWFSPTDSELNKIKNKMKTYFLEQLSLKEKNFI